MAPKTRIKIEKISGTALGAGTARLMFAGSLAAENLPERHAAVEIDAAEQTRLDKLEYIKHELTDMFSISCKQLRVSRPRSLITGLASFGRSWLPRPCHLDFLPLGQDKPTYLTPCNHLDS